MIFSNVDKTRAKEIAEKLLSLDPRGTKPAKVIERDLRCLAETFLTLLDGKHPFSKNPSYKNRPF
jgi:hypothetical protein